MFRKALAFVICSLAVILPWKLRCLYSEAIGWLVQFFYFIYTSILKIFVKELGKAKNRDKKSE